MTDPRKLPSCMWTRNGQLYVVTPFGISPARDEDHAWRILRFAIAAPAVAFCVALVVCGLVLTIALAA